MAATRNPQANKGIAFFHDYVGDTQDNIKKCLSCTYPECINCLSFSKVPEKPTQIDMEQVRTLKRSKKMSKGLSKNERAILKAYVSQMKDYEISKVVGLTQSAVCEARTILGLPLAKALPPDDKQKLVNEWLAP